ncbi:hypothetical protein LJY25_08125 [Hymenobacter sp. BT175]|uniref:hypothetical protein n=1 Tax=Hymenobacter translucens TaxID=2886507 RepID=UPI001D0EF3CF|nr:hypothetical protein [Hymenobacter translucens]MCC2546408.1 hypothetical protein [Hymenobacter translucens]
MNNRALWISLEVGAVVAGAVSSFVEKHIWSPSYSYFMLMLLLIVDLTATVLLKQRKFRRWWLLILPAYTLVLSFAHSFGTHEPGLIWLPQAVIGLVVLIHLRRLIINFGKLQLMDDDVATVLNARLKRRIDMIEAEKAAEDAAEEVPETAPATLPEHEAVPA